VSSAGYTVQEEWTKTTTRPPERRSSILLWTVNAECPLPRRLFEPEDKGNKICPVDMVLLPKSLESSTCYLFSSSKMLVTVYQTTRRHMPVDCTHTRREILRSENINCGTKVLLCGSNNALYCHRSRFMKMKLQKLKIYAATFGRHCQGKIQRYFQV
jgi:hypothetical protein